MQHKVRKLDDVMFFKVVNSFEIKPRLYGMFFSFVFVGIVLQYTNILILLIISGISYFLFISFFVVLVFSYFY